MVLHFKDKTARAQGSSDLIGHPLLGTQSERGPRTRGQGPLARCRTARRRLEKRLFSGLAERGRDQEADGKHVFEAPILMATFFFENNRLR